MIEALTCIILINFSSGEQAFYGPFPETECNDMMQHNLEDARIDDPHASAKRIDAGINLAPRVSLKPRPRP